MRVLSADWVLPVAAPPIPDGAVAVDGDRIVGSATLELDGRTSDEVGPLAENIEVYSSHASLGVHPAVTFALLDRLRLHFSIGEAY